MAIIDKRSSLLHTRVCRHERFVTLITELYVLGMLLHSITATTVKAVETVVLGILNVFSGNTNRREKAQYS